MRVRASVKGVTYLGAVNNEVRLGLRYAIWRPCEPRFRMKLEAVRGPAQTSVQTMQVLSFRLRRQAA